MNETHSRLTAEVAAFLAGAPIPLLAQLLDRGPVEITPPLAARLTGRSPKAIRAALDAGTLPGSGKAQRYVLLTDLAEWHGRPFSAGDLHRILNR